jgi:hypothetical protein
VAAVQLQQKGVKGEGTAVHWCRTDPRQMATCTETGHIHVWNAGGRNSREAECADDSPIELRDSAQECDTSLRDTPSRISDGTTFSLSFVHNQPYLSASSQVELTPHSKDLETLRRPQQVQHEQQLPVTPQVESRADPDEWFTPPVSVPIVAPIDLESGWRMNLSPDRRSQHTARTNNFSQVVSEVPSQHGLMSLGGTGAPSTEDAAPQPIRYVLLHRPLDCMLLGAMFWATSLSNGLSYNTFS